MSSNRCLKRRLSSHPNANALPGFSLIELVVAMAVLSILLLLVFQLVSSTSQLIKDDARRMDAVGQARVALDRIDLDWAARIRRSDLNVAFTKTQGNDAFSFYGGVPSYGGTRKIASVAFQIFNNPAATSPLETFYLERGALGVSWTGGIALNFLPAKLTPPQSDGNANSTTSDFQPLAPAIFRLELCFLRRSDGQLTATDPGLANTSAVVVAVVAIDTDSRALVTVAQLSALAAQFPDAVEGQDLLTTWSPILVNMGSTFLPTKAAQGVRIAERYYYVD